MNDIDIEKPTFTLSYSGYNFQSNVKFDAESWPVALAQFIKFLRGAGYYIEVDKILINDRDLVIPAEDYAQDFE